MTPRDVAAIQRALILVTSALDSLTVLRAVDARGAAMALVRRAIKIARGFGANRADVDNMIEAAWKEYT